MNHPATSFRNASAVALGLFCLLPTTQGYAGDTRDLSIGFSRPQEGGLLVLDDRTCVLWRSHGHLRIRPRDGNWIDFFVPGVDWIRHAVPDQAGILVFGSTNTPSGHIDDVILLLDRQGAVVDRWKPQTGVVAIFTESGRRMATLFGPSPRQYLHDADGRDIWPPAKTDRIADLLPGGNVDERDSIEPHAKIVSLHGGEAGKSRVDCVGMNLAKEHYRDSYCVAGGPGGWREFGLWDDPAPFTCGPFLIELFEGADDIGRRDKKPRITVRRLDDGSVAGERPVKPGFAYGCGPDDELLVAKGDVQAWSLPSLKTLWQVRGGHGRIVAVTGDNDQILTATRSGDIFSLSASTKTKQQKSHSQVNHAAH